MKITLSTDPDLTGEQATLVTEGAGVIVSDGTNSAGLWHKNTPIHEEKPIGTIGGCQLANSPGAAAFLAECADYLHHQHGCHTVVGPMNGNTWLKHRLVIESDGRDPFLMEPVEPAHFHDVFSTAGFSILSRYSSSTIDLSTEPQSFASLERRIEKQDVTYRGINPTAFEQDLGDIFDLSLISFSNNFLYTPISKASFVGKYAASQQHIDPDMVILAERKGQLVGYVFCMPDLAAVQLGKPPAIIIKTLAALPDRSLSGLGTVLVAKAQQMAKTKDYTEAIHALQFENNSSLRISQRFDARVFRRYALMAKSFS